jgi:SNF2 family DNA or RNA helicase
MPLPDDLSEKVREALAVSGIDSVAVKGTVGQQIKTIAVFQKDKPAKGDPRVLLLKMDDEQSAGLNLTNLNHAVFVHPLLANTQEEYDAYETQAIGRLRRYGQKKTVHVWRFLAKDTIDTKIIAQRSPLFIPSIENSDEQWLQKNLPQPR